MTTTSDRATAADAATELAGQNERRRRGLRELAGIVVVFIVFIALRSSQAAGPNRQCSAR